MSARRFIRLGRRPPLAVLVVLVILGLVLSGRDDEPAPPGQPAQPGRELPPAPERRGGRDARSFAVPSRALRDRIARVTDGDTVVLSGLGKSRLIGVDTPEVFGGEECFGRQASGFTKRTLPPGTRVRYLRGVEPRDRYGRALVYLWLPDGRFLNALLVRFGYATPLTIPPNVSYAERFLALARAARRAGRGLWASGACA